MSQDLALRMHTILLKSGIELEIEPERVPNIDAALANKDLQFIEINGQRVSRYSIEGIFDPEHMDQLHKKNNGQWKCKHGTWHDKFEKCHCVPDDQKETVETTVTDPLTGEKKPVKYTRQRS